MMISTWAMKSRREALLARTEDDNNCSDDESPCSEEFLRSKSNIISDHEPETEGGEQDSIASKDEESFEFESNEDTVKSFSEGDMSSDYMVSNDKISDGKSILHEPAEPPDSGGLLGRGTRGAKNKNPRYFGDEFTNFQFLQQSFESLDPETCETYLKYAL